MTATDGDAPKRDALVGGERSAATKPHILAEIPAETIERLLVAKHKS